MAYTHNSGVLVLVLTVTLILGASAAPSRQRRDAAATIPRWHRPCAGSEPVPGVPAPTTNPAAAPSPRNTAQQFGSIRQLALIARDSSERLKLRYVIDRFGGMTYAEQLADFRIAGVPQVPNRPRSIFTPQVNQSVQESHQWVAKCIVFLNLTDMDEAVQEEEYGSSFRNETERLLDEYYNLLCILEVSLSELGITPLERPNTDIILEEHRVPENTAIRYKRDYIIVRDCRTVMAETRLNFAALERQARPPTVQQ